MVPRTEKAKAVGIYRGICERTGLRLARHREPCQAGDRAALRRIVWCDAGCLSVHIFYVPIVFFFYHPQRKERRRLYKALYRKYRPQKFSDVVGQPQVTVTLKNELMAGRISHAYLFTGSRGTGKTTCAKILAKAVNCLDPQNGDPCGKCDVCRGLDDGSVLDVVELDAASNNGVDSIRALIEESNFTPTTAKYRVYIIDEVHMLSVSAFNALLKTLEEPPAHVIFILATTKSISCCRRFYRAVSVLTSAASHRRTSQGALSGSARRKM